MENSVKSWWIFFYFNPEVAHTVMQLLSRRDLATVTYLLLPLLQCAKRNTAGVKLCITVCKRSAAYGRNQRGISYGNKSIFFIFPLWHNF
jgi:hypothetical protein